MSGFGWWKDCACCGGNCTIFSDDFSSNTIASYDQRSGSWSIGSGVLTTSSASALLRCETACDSGATGAHATAIFTPGSTSDIGRLVLGYVDDSNYWFLEVQMGASNGSLKLFQRSGGTNAQKGSTTTITGYNAGAVTMCLSIGSGVVIAWAGSATGHVASIAFAASPTMASTKAGLGTGSGTTSATFDDFFFNKHHADDSSCSHCTSLGCATLCTSSPTSVSATFGGITNAQSCVHCPDANATFVINPLNTCSQTSGDTLVCTTNAAGQGEFRYLIFDKFSNGHSWLQISIVFSDGLGNGTGFLFATDLGVSPALCEFSGALPLVSTVTSGIGVCGGTPTCNVVVF